MRSITPVHPLAAAIQSIGIVQRDIEGQGELGRALLPALILHGAFDFVLMAYGMFLVPSEEIPLDEDSNGPPPVDLKGMFVSTAIGFGVMLVGVFYYFYQAGKQRERLYALESTRGEAPEASNLCRDISRLSDERSFS